MANDESSKSNKGALVPEDGSSPTGGSADRVPDQDTGGPLDSGSTGQRQLGKKRDDVIAILCSECGMSYMADSGADASLLHCPHCPSAELEEKATRRGPGLPKFGWSLGAAQLIAVALTFGVFLALVIALLSQNDIGRKRPLSRDALFQRMMGELREALPVARSGTQSTRPQDSESSVAMSSEPFGSKWREDDSNGAPTSEESTDGSARIVSDAAESIDSPSTTGRREEFERSPEPIASASERASDSSPSEAVLQRQRDEAQAIAMEASRPPVPKNNVTTQFVMTNAKRLVGHQLEMLCKIASVNYDAQNRVPNKFQLNGRDVQLSSDDEKNYCRLEVVDSEGRVFANVFAPIEGPVGRSLAWMQAGDWAILTCTPGTRYDRYVGRFQWGLIVTDIVPPESEASPTARVKPSDN